MLGTAVPSSTPIRLLIADDHRFFRRGLRQVCELEADLEVVGEASNGLEAIEVAQEVRPDVILMDLLMPELDGIKATRRITTDLPTARVIILTVQQQDHYLFDAIRAGASGYLLKDVEEETLLAAIRAIHQGNSIINPHLATRMIEEFRRLSAKEANNGWVEQLNQGEFDVLRLVAEGWDNPQIAQRLTLSERTVTNRLSQIYDKLHLNNRTEAAIYALRQGWATLYPEAEDTPPGI